MADAPTWNGPRFDHDEEVEQRLDAWLPRPEMGGGTPIESEDEFSFAPDGSILVNGVPEETVRWSGSMRSEPAPSCEPTYALSHRWGWPDANGVMRCACGSEMRHPSQRIACSIHSVFWRRPARPWVKTSFEWLNDLQERFVYVEMWSDPRRYGDEVAAERQRCERLGVEWMGPDVQDAPPWTPEEGYALGISSAEIEEAWNEYVGRHGLTVYRDPMWQEVIIDEIDAAEELRAELDDDAENEQAFKLAHPGESCAWRAHGNIVRLGCELREADGVTAK